MRSRGNANYWHKITQGFPPECLNSPTPSHCRSEPEGTAGYCRTAEGPVARTVTFNLAIRKSSVLSRRLTGHPFSNIAAQSSLSAFSRMSRRDRALARSSVLREWRTNGARLSISTSVFWGQSFNSRPADVVLFARCCRHFFYYLLWRLPTCEDYRLL